MIYYSRHVFSKSFITRKQMEDFIELIDGLLDDSDELYKLLKQPSITQFNQKIKVNKKTLIELETDVFDELEDTPLNKIKKLNQLQEEYEENNEETIIDGDTLVEEEQTEKDEFAFGDDEEIVEEDDDENPQKSSLKIKSQIDEEEKEE